MYPGQLLTLLFAVLFPAVSFASVADQEPVDAPFTLEDNPIRLRAEINGQPATVVRFHSAQKFFARLIAAACELLSPPQRRTTTDIPWRPK